MWKVAKRAKLRKGELVGVHFSPNCKPRSIINGLEAANERGEGAHAGKEEDLSESAALQEIVQAILDLHHNHPHISWTLEQPARSSMEQDPEFEPLPE